MEATTKIYGYALCRIAPSINDYKKREAEKYKQFMKTFGVAHKDVFIPITSLWSKIIESEY